MGKESAKLMTIANKGERTVRHVPYPDGASFALLRF